MAAITAQALAVVIRATPSQTSFEPGYEIKNLSPTAAAHRAMVFRQQVSIGNNHEGRVDGWPPNDPDAPRRFERLIMPETTRTLAVED